MRREPSKLGGEIIFCQSKQKSARIVDPIRRIFVTNDGKDSADSLCGEFLEMPYKKCGCREVFPSTLLYHAQPILSRGGWAERIPHKINHRLIDKKGSVCYNKTITET